MHRRVCLMRGNLALSVADNWWVPERLPPGMRASLSASDVPFGELIEPLGPSRRTHFVRFVLEAEAAAVENAMGHGDRTVVLEHKAIVVDRHGTPLSVVHERYLAALVL